jgi:hypothetical protein
VRWKLRRKSAGSEPAGPDDARRALDDSTRALAQAYALDSEILEVGKKLRVIRRENHLEVMIRQAVQGGH